MNLTNLITEAAAANYMVAKANYKEDDLGKITVTLEHEESAAVTADVVCTEDKEKKWLIHIALDPVKSNYIPTIGATGILMEIVKRFVNNFILNTEKKLEG